VQIIFGDSFNYVWNIGNPKSLNGGKISLSLLSKISLGKKNIDSV
jgi:hypothetical protein